MAFQVAIQLDYVFTDYFIIRMLVRKANLQ